jgi:hypothetical protein
LHRPLECYALLICLFEHLLVHDVNRILIHVPAYLDMVPLHVLSSFTVHYVPGFVGPMGDQAQLVAIRFYRTFDISERAGLLFLAIKHPLPSLVTRRKHPKLNSREMLTFSTTGAFFYFVGGHTLGQTYLHGEVDIR